MICFVIGHDRVVQKRALKVGFINKTTAVIDDGLAPGELVVVDSDGTLIRVRPMFTLDSLTCLSRESRHRLVAGNLNCLMVTCELVR